MAKRHKVKKFSFQSFNVAHYRTTEAYARAVERIMDAAMEEIALATHGIKPSSSKVFSFDDHPRAKAQMQKIISELAKNMTSVISSGSRKEWLFACKKNDEFIASILDTSKVSKVRLNKMQDQNLDALKTFQARKVAGMNLSERVWKYTKQFRDQIEVGLDVGLGEGRSAQQLSRDLRQNLQDPNRLFRRVRGKHGNLTLSKAAKAFHPGQGVYRSSYRNAMRLARSEVNMAYRESDHVRWQALDFIVGFEIKRSNREPRYKCKLCDRLAGRYPKTFKFKGWHPQCLCWADPILKSRDDLNRDEAGDLRAALKGERYDKQASKNSVTDFPDNFKDWVSENAPKQAGWASTPYFIKDNFKDGKLSEGLIYAPSNNTAKRIKSPEQIADIQKRWDERKKKHDLIKKVASNVLNVARGYAEVDYSELESIVENGNLNKMQEVTKQVAKAIAVVKEEEKALSDVIPNVHEWHKQFTLESLKSVHKAVSQKLTTWSSLTLEQQAKKLKFEAEEYFGTNKYGAQDKYPTWEVAKEAYKKKLEVVQYKIDKQAVAENAVHAFDFAKKTKSAKVKALVVELNGLFDQDAPIDMIKGKLGILNAEVSKLEAQKLARSLKKLGALGEGFAKEAYTQDRKDKAVWDKGSGKVADDALIGMAGKAWSSATDDEKDRVYEYTHHYCNVNEPLQGRTYFGTQKRSDFEHRVNNITSYINKNAIPKDMWFMRGDDSLDAIASRIKFAGGSMPKALNDLVGMTMQEGGFMSTGSRKGKGFAHKSVIINIYAPKGTRAAYLEPISSFGNGAGRSWDGKQRFKSFSSEHETLFQRGTIMRITKVYKVGGTTYIDCEVIGQEPKPLSYVKDSNIGY